MKIHIEIVAHVPDATTEQDVRGIFHDAMYLYSKSAAMHRKLDKNAIALSLVERRDSLTMTELTVLDDLADV